MTLQLGEHTQDERSPCLLHIEPQLEPSTGLCPNVSHSQYRQTPADFWNCKEHFHEHTDSSKSAAPQQQLPPQMGTWLQDIHIHSEQHRLIPFQTPTQKVTVEAMGRWDTLTASRLTAPSALPQYRPVPGAGLHQGRGAGICLLFCFLAEYIGRQSHVLRVQAWDTCHRLHKYPQTSYSLSLCVLSGSVRNLALSFAVNVDKRLLLFCHIYQTLKNLTKSQVSFRNLTAIMLLVST